MASDQIVGMDRHRGVGGRCGGGGWVPADCWGPRVAGTKGGGVMPTPVRVMPGRVGIVLTKPAARKLSAARAGRANKVKALLAKLDAKGRVKG